MSSAPQQDRTQGGARPRSEGMLVAAPRRLSDFAGSTTHQRSHEPHSSPGAPTGSLRPVRVKGWRVDGLASRPAGGPLGELSTCCGHQHPGRLGSLCPGHPVDRDSQAHHDAQPGRMRSPVHLAAVRGPCQRSRHGRLETLVITVKAFPKHRGELGERAKVDHETAIRSLAGAGSLAGRPGRPARQRIHGGERILRHCYSRTTSRPATSRLNTSERGPGSASCLCTRPQPSSQDWPSSTSATPASGRPAGDRRSGLKYGGPVHEYRPVEVAVIDLCRTADGAQLVRLRCRLVSELHPPLPHGPVGA